MSAYYNEKNAHAAQWLRNLIAAGLVPAGEVDERSIRDVRAGDLAGYSECHFFAGIGIWAAALHDAGGPRPGQNVWTGSCPCQPVSGLGQRKGAADERHLWPVWFDLIRICRPAKIFGEQVAGGDGLEWLAGVRADLEGAAYAVGAANLPAGGYGSPQKRERNWFIAVGDPESIGRREGVGAFGSQARSRTQARQPSWSGEVVLGRDGTRRRIAPGTRFLAHGHRDRMDELRAIGNAIVRRAAAEFIAAAQECLP